MTPGRGVETAPPPNGSVPDEDAESEANPFDRDRLVPPQTEAIARELAAGDRSLCHCLDCGQQLVAIQHGSSCLFCGSEAVIVE